MTREMLAERARVLYGEAWAEAMGGSLRLPYLEARAMTAEMRAQEDYGDTFAGRLETAFVDRLVKELPGD